MNTMGRQQLDHDWKHRVSGRSRRSRTTLGRSGLGRSGLGRRIRPLETLEPRQLLAGDTSLADDYLVVRQNSAEQVIQVLANDEFADDYGGNREITSVSFGSEGGQLRVSEDRRSVLYAPPADYHGEEIFNYFVDGTLAATVHVDIDPPALDDHFFIVPDGETHKLDVLANDPFWDDYTGDREITLTSVTSNDTSHVTIAPDGRSVLYTPSEFDFGRDEFVYIVDGKYPARVNIDVPLVLNHDEYEVVTHNEARRFNVLANDPFWDGYDGQRTITALYNDSASEELPGSQVRISADGKAIVFTPGAERRTESLRYIVDGRLEGHVTVRSYVPVQNDHAVVDRGSSNFAINVTGNDRYYSYLQRREIDVVDRVTSVSETTLNGGSVSISPGGQAVSYTAPDGFVGTDEFTYVADGVHEATVFVNVREPMSDDHVTVKQTFGGQFVDVLSNDFYGNGYQGAKQITSVSETTAGGTVTIDGNRLLYTPNGNQLDSDSFRYVVDGELEAEVMVAIQPLAQHDWFNLCLNGPSPLTLDVLTNDHFSDSRYQGAGKITSVQSDDPLLAAALEIVGEGGHLRLTPNGTRGSSFTYTVDDTYTATSSVWLTNHLQLDRYVVDQNGGTSRFELLANDFQRWENARCSSSQYRGDRLISSVSETEHGGTVEIIDQGRAIHYTPPADFHGTDRFTYQVDGVMESDVEISVARYVQDDTLRVAPGATATLDVTANDLFSGYQGAQAITAVTSSEAGAAISIDGSGNLSYTPADDFVGTDRFSYTVDDQLIAHVEVLVQPDSAELYPTFATLDDFQQFMLDDAIERYQYLFGQGYYGRGDVFDGGFAEDSAGPPRDFSETNVQVEGVDEADLMEFDADHLYYLAGNELVIFDAWPAETLSEVSRTPIAGNVIGQYLMDDRLTVVSQTVEYKTPIWWEDVLIDRPATGFAPDLASDIAFWPIYGAASYQTHITVLDVADRTTPRVVQETTMEGQYVQSRRVGDFVYVAVNNQPALSEPLAIELEDGSQRYETEEEYVTRVTADLGSMVDEALPNYTSVDADGQVVRSGLLHEPEDIFKPLSSSADSLISLVSIDITNEAAGLAASSGVFTTGGSIVYASLNHFYIFETDYLNSEVGMSTRILQFDWNGETGEAQFSSSGVVPGTMVNQFSADEYDGHLRIATTVRNGYGSAKWFSPSENDLFVLRDDSGVLEYTGSLQNLALGETTRSVRFMGERAMVTTARQIDPLFAIDVSEPTAPRAEGYLTLPGFSGYMHPVGEEFLITVGTNSPNGGGGPAQVSLFNISEPTQPLMIDEFTFERFSLTEANTDHHAFGYFQRHGLLAMPSMRNYVRRVDTDGDGFSETREWVTEHELMVFAVDTTAQPGSNLGLQLVGEIAHDTSVRRSGYIGDMLFSIADDSVKVVNVAAPDTVVASVTDLVDEEPIDLPVPVPFDFDELFVAARADVADRLSVSSSLALPVVAEQSDAGWRTVLRVGESYYRYDVTESGAELVDAEFEFSDAHDISWQNTDQPFDVNGDGEVTPLDALLLIDSLDGQAAHPVSDRLVVRQIGQPGDHETRYLDPNADGWISPLDILLLIEHLNKTTSVGINTGSLDSNSPDSLSDPDAVDGLFGRVEESIGDANLDGKFDSSDLVSIFQAGKYETDDDANWAEGDWDGDGSFTSRDIVEAFVRGQYRA